jgi:hypothetical protein
MWLYFCLSSVLLYVAQYNGIYFLLYLPCLTLHPQHSNLPFVALPHLLLLHPLLDPNPVFCCSTHNLPTLPYLASSLTPNTLAACLRILSTFLQNMPCTLTIIFPNQQPLYKRCCKHCAVLLFILKSCRLYMFLFNGKYLAFNSRTVKMESLSRRLFVFYNIKSHDDCEYTTKQWSYSP